MSDTSTAFEGGHAISLPQSTAGAGGREVRVLVEEPHLKLLWIALGRGGELPEHGVPMPITLQALTGAGSVWLGGEEQRIEPGRVLSLEPGVTHAVRADPGSELVLLVHQLRSSRPPARPWTGELG